MTASVHPDDSGSPRELPHPTATDAPGTEGSLDRGPVVVPESARFEGLLTYRGRAQVDGEVEGEILCRGTLRVGEHGRVIGTIEADELIVAGVLEGEATARRRLELTATARVRGTIRSPLLQFADGCCVEGRCETGPPSVPEDT